MHLDCNAEVSIEESEEVSQIKDSTFYYVLFRSWPFSFGFLIRSIHLSVNLFLKLAVVYIQFCSSIERL